MVRIINPAAITYCVVAFALLARHHVEGSTNALRRITSINENDHHEDRQLTDCDSLDACYLVNIATRAETKLTPGGSNTATLDLISNPNGYSIRCDVTDTSKGESDFIKFMYDHVVQEEFGLPRFMNGDSDEGDYINPVPYLQTCGQKRIKIEGHVWSKKCFESTFQLHLRCPVCPTAITNLKLVDAERRTDIMELADYSISETLSSNKFNIRAVPQQCLPKSVDSVQFKFDGRIIRCEKYTPYALYGDPSTSDRAENNADADYNAAAIPLGHHTITATPYAGEACTGKKGTSLTRTFTVTA